MKTSTRSASFVLVPVLFLSLAGCASSAKTLEKSDPGKVYSYRVKFLCSHLHPFPTVFHWTDVNVLNPSKSKPALVTKKFIASGKQKQPSRIQPRRDEFQLTPNQSANINCDEIQSMLGQPLSTPLEGFVEIESRTKLTVVGVYDKCVPQPRTDVFPHSVVTALVSIDGLIQRQQVRLTGPVVVKKGEPRILPDGRRFVQPTEIESMDVRGTVGTTMGTVDVQIFESPELTSAGQISGRIDPESLALVPPYDSYFNVNAVLRFKPPEGPPRDLLLLDARVSAPLTSIPPVPPIKDGQTGGGTEAGVYGKVETPIRDPITGRKVGTLQELRHSPFNGSGNGHGDPKHSPVSCDNASIDVEYVEPEELHEPAQDKYKEIEKKK